jgi:hypothetical protein
MGNVNTRCMWGDGSCPKEQEWHCKVLLKDGVHGQSLCDDHAEWYMRNNTQAGHGPWAKKVNQDDT